MERQKKQDAKFWIKTYYIKLRIKKKSNNKQTKTKQNLTLLRNTAVPVLHEDDPSFILIVDIAELILRC